MKLFKKKTQMFFIWLNFLYIYNGKFLKYNTFAVRSNNNYLNKRCDVATMKVENPQSVRFIAIW